MHVNEDHERSRIERELHAAKRLLREVLEALDASVTVRRKQEIRERVEATVGP